MSAPAKATRNRRPQGPRVAGGSREARLHAAAILDVLAGGRSPAQAAACLGISQPRYYALEARALEGLILACEPRRKGKRRTPEREMDLLQEKVQSLERECARKQALLRAAQRAVGLVAPPPAAAGKKRRKRAVVRALRAAATLRSEPPAPDPLPQI